MRMEDVDLNLVSPMMKQYIEVKTKNKDIIIFFRIGDFYEMFFEDANLVSRLLELTLTGKNAGLDERIPMCGVPHHAASVYIDKLIDLGYKVGICEQLQDPKTTKGLVDRGLIQIVSKGTIINTELLNEKDYNYIGNIIDNNYCYTLCYCDITTGIIKVSTLEHSQTKLVSEIVSIGIKEIIVNSNFDKTITNLLQDHFKISISYSDEIDEINDYKYIYEDMDDIRYINSINHLLTYINNTQMKILNHFQKAIITNYNDYLKMDIYTKRNLELTETLRLKQRNYSLIWLLDKTKTAMGSRLLKTWIENPLIDIKKINDRYDIVTKLLNEFIIKNDLQQLLYEVYDLERLSGKVAFSSANARDMLQLKSSLKVLPGINELLIKLNYKNMDCMEELYNLLDKSIYENPPVTLKEGYLIKEGYNKELDELKSLRSNGKDFVAKFENEEKERTGIKNLKVGYNRVFGYYIEVSKGSINLVKDSFGYERRQTLANCERYISPILKEKEAMILNAEERIIELEYSIFNEIKNTVKKYIPTLQKVSKIISEIDVLQSFATVSSDNNYNRPTLTTDSIIDIKESRHPVVEKVISNEFVSNDILMDKKTSILLITGPNMAGKSTFMRQLAITVIMAQIGCFVPASMATLPVFDAIYTRIGASDDLVNGESTFMVEMSEANNAISNATSNSLILFDELGRGTATYDGMALAQAIIEYIHTNIKCKTLFSTHYHELTDLEKQLSGVKNVHVSAYEENGKLTFLHKIKDGSIDKSYGIHVAKLASLPDSLINRADEILKIYEKKDNKREVIQQVLPLDSITKDSLVEEKLKTINPLEITPMDAINTLYELKKLIK